MDIGQGEDKTKLEEQTILNMEEETFIENLTNAKLRRAELKSLDNSVIQTMKDKLNAESILAENDTRYAEHVTNYTLKVPIENAFLQAGLIATMKYTDKERQTIKTNDDTPTNCGSMANHDTMWKT